jgi:hypothetical protein
MYLDTPGAVSSRDPFVVEPTPEDRDALPLPSLPSMPSPAAAAVIFAAGAAATRRRRTTVVVVVVAAVTHQGPETHRLGTLSSFGCNVVFK